MQKKVFLDLKNLSKNQCDLIKDLTVPILYRYSLILIRKYPSIKRDEMRECLILEYHDGKKISDEHEIDKGLFSARGFLHHLITYELIMRELNDKEKFSVSHKFDLGVNHMPIDKSKKEKSDNFEYF